MGKEEISKEEIQVENLNSKLRNPGDFQDPDELFNELLARIRKYHPSDDLSMIEKAFALAKEMHKDQKRKSGEPYIIHPICVGLILADLELDKETIAAGLLHDVVEDTDYTLEDIEKLFGSDVAQLVDGVSKLSNLNYKADKVEMQAENLRKMFLAMAKDIRVILIKLADRLHNMRTLQYMTPEKRLEKANETLDIYCPLAMRLGISKIKGEMDDLALKYIHPDVYYDLVEKVNLKRSERQAFIDEMVDEIKKKIEEAGISASIDGRAKHFFSIYKKMVNQDKTIDQIYDLFAIRIIVNTVQDCYAALGVIHEMYKPIPGRFKDYIAMPKANMYQSLHTTLMGPNGTPFEIQIRTVEMHKTAEFGIAAHWKYKESSDGKVQNDQGEEKKLAWLRQILEWQREMSDNHEFLSLLKSDFNLFDENVYCFTPEGDIKTLPQGSNTIDFAYLVHTAVGNKMVGARVNDKLVPIEYVLKNGDRVEIITSQNSRGPSLDWLNTVKSTQAKTKINQWFRKQNKEENIVRGKEYLAALAKDKNVDLSKVAAPEYQEVILRKYGFRDWNAVLAAIGHGGLKEGQVLNKLVDTYNKQVKNNLTDADIIESSTKNKEKVQPERAKSHNGIVVRGIHDVAVRFSKCCNPIPGDEIIGFVTRGRGISIHRTDCVNVINMSEEDRHRVIEAEWQQESVKEGNEVYKADINIYANNRTGLLIDISKVFIEKKIDMDSLNVRISKQGIVTIETSFPVHSTEELNSISEKLRNVESVLDIERKKS